MTSRPRRGSIERRLPVLATVLLLLTISAMAAAAYVELRAFALQATGSRLLQQATDLAELMGRSSPVRLAQLDTVARAPAVRELLRSGGARGRDAALAVLLGMSRSSTTISVDLRGASGRVLLATPDSAIPDRVEVTGWGSLRLGPDGRVLYAIAQPVLHEGRMIGQVVERRRVTASSQSRQTLTTLMGGSAQLLYANVAGDLWTDMIASVPPPRAGSVMPGTTATYERDGAIRIGAMAGVPGTPLAFIVEVPQAVVLAPARRYVSRIGLIAGLVLLVGVSAAWALSRNLTNPLKTLTAAAESVAGGDVDQRAAIHRDDELGRLAEAFNVMAARVGEARRTLEQQVAERTREIRRALEQLQESNEALLREGEERERADTAVRNLNAELQHQVGELEAVNHELETFSYSVSHDLRAPLRAIDGFSRIVNEQYDPVLDDEGRRLLGVIRDNTSRMGQLIDDLLEFSRLGRKALRAEPVSMADMVRGVVDDASRGAPRAEIVIGELPPAYGDAALLRQVWMNLIDNALKYSRTQPQARVEIGIHADGNGEAGYYVRDNGVGFDMAYAHQLFGVFQRLHPADVFEGTGVGLAIVQRIVHRHGGRVWARGAIDNGATFSFSLPPRAHA